MRSSGCTPKQLAEITKLMVGFQDLRHNGAAAIDFCHVTEGALDAYFERDIKAYDWAAAALIAEEAGVPVIRPKVVGDAAVIGMVEGLRPSHTCHYFLTDSSHIFVNRCEP